jgi:hypothetical protein
LDAGGYYRSFLARRDAASTPAEALVANFPTPLAEQNLHRSGMAVGKTRFPAE